MKSPISVLDPVRLEVFRYLFTALAEEMGAALRGAAYSPNIKERRDYSCALFDGAGRVVAMGDHMPVHLGAMPMSVRAAIDAFPALDPGDIVLLNDPFCGGTHLPDITLVAPVFDPGSGRPRRARNPSVSADAAPLAYLSVRAHHADVGGIAAGSMPLAREIYQEGLRLPPVLLMRGGERNADVWRIIAANVRTPIERAGDLGAQVGCIARGEQRLLELVAARGASQVRSAMSGLIEYADRLVRAGISRIPDGEYRAADVLEDDGFGNGPLPIRVCIRVHGAELSVDYTGSAAQTTGGINAVAAITSSATRYVVRCIVEALLGQALPAGGGEMAALHLELPGRSIVNAEPPASVAAGNVETSQRITDTLLAAFAHALPELMPAQSQGTMNNLTVGGIDPRTGEPFAYYETMGGGMGGRRGLPGLSGVHTHMSNTRNTPVEAIEHYLPVRIRQYALRKGSGGA
ncbi:MAG TPA: hydantoinase B/oxoprolinase family protein, partial [Longimicrobiales bacterium]|nr:hydantoinase B/oxoprolinase family protein [Longimicrobiales bacterium]